MGMLAKQVPQEQRFAIFKEANAKTELTPLERMEWVIEQFEQIIKSQETNKDE